MLWQIRLGLLIAAALSLTSLAFAQANDYDRRPRTASVSGRVTVGGKPAANITVTVTEDYSGMFAVKIIALGGRDTVDPHFYKATTDSEGRYQINGLPAGTYNIIPRAAAYVPESKFLAQNSAIKITLDEGEAREKVDFALVRGGVITGRVTDEDGRPQIGRTVRLMEVSNQNEPRYEPNLFNRGLETDDRGIYRLFGLRSGRYIVMAGGEDDWLRHLVKAKRTQLTYHPDVLNQAEAKVIEVTDGSEITGVDIRLRDPVKSYTVSGRVVDSETGKPVPQAQVNCFSVENQEEESGNSVANPTTDTEGNFSAAGLKPGKYKAKVFVHQVYGGEYYSESKFFEVHDADLNGVEIPARRGATIRGVVIVEEGADALTQTRLAQSTLDMTVMQPYLQSYRSVGWLMTKIGADGGFQLNGAPPGKAMIRLPFASSPPLHFLRIERGGAVVGDTLEISPGEKIDNVRVIVAQGGGSIRGSLKIVGGTLPDGAALSVDAFREGPPAVHASGVADEKGRFVIKGLLTGEYRLNISASINIHPLLSRGLPLPRLPEQRVNVTNGSETQINITYDLGRKEQEKEK
jgi:protocatechuate 3,4-dioxygenase beta subunit